MKQGNLKAQLEIATEWAIALRYEDIPQRVLAVARLQIANILAAILAGSQSRAGVRTKASFERTLALGSCTLIPHGDRCPIFDAVYLHAVYATMPWN